MARVLRIGVWSILGLSLWVLAGCSSAAPTSTPTAAPTRTPTSTPLPTETATPAPSPTPSKTPTPDLSGTLGISLVAMETNLGTIVVDGERSRAVYVFAADPPGRSTCTGSCTNLWPPLLTEGFPQAGEGIRAELLGYITLREGGFQVTYDNQPLYGYAGDLNPGSALGHGVGGNWSAIRPDGRPR